MRAEAIGPYFGGWRRARRPFTCANAFGHTGAKGCAGAVDVAVGEEYYDTGEGSGFHNWTTVRICRACAEAERERWRKLPGVGHAQP